MEFRVEERVAGRVRVALRGDVTGPEWRRRLVSFLEEHHLEEGVREVVLDLGGVRVLDERAPSALAQLARRSRKRGRRLVVEGIEARSFRSEAHELRGVRAFVRDCATSYGLGPGGVEELVLAASEACTNAVQHAGTERIEVACRRLGACVEVTIVDRGVYAERLDPLDPLVERGRGIVMMAAMTDEVTIRKGTPEAPGTIVRLLKCREPRPLGEEPGSV